MEKTKNSNNKKSSRDKHKRHSGHQHHPWDDEVSLPGAGIDAEDDLSKLESSTVLEVISKANANGSEQLSLETEQQDFSSKPIETEAEIVHAVPPAIASIVDETTKFGCENFSLNCDTSINNKLNELEEINVLSEEPKEITAKTQKNVLDIESHLIETFDENQEHNESIGIKELSPTEQELEYELEKATKIVINEIDELNETVKAKEKSIDDAIAPLSNQVLINDDDGNGDEDEDQDITKVAKNLAKEIETEAVEALTHTNSQILDNHEKTDELALKTPPNQIELIDVNENQTTLSQRVDEQLSEVTSILKKTTSNHLQSSTPSCDQIKLVDVPSPKTASEAEERKLFIDSLPQISATDTDTEAQKLAIDCKREYYQSLKKYLIQSTADKPPVPLQTYRWEDLRRAKERGGYPWTHLYKRPLGPDEDPEIVLLLRKSQELRFASESPKSLKKVRIDDQVLIKETERYIQELSEEEDAEEEAEEDAEEDNEHVQNHSADDAENQSVHSESISCVSDSVLATSKPRKPYLRLANIRAIIKRRRSGRTNEDSQSLPGTLDRTKSSKVPKIQLEPTEGPIQQLSEEQSPHKTPSCYPIMKKLKSMADRQKKRLHIKRVPLIKEERIVLNDETKIIKLKKSPKSKRGDIPHFIEKQDSDDILEIVELDESPSRKHKDEDYTEDGEEASSSHTATATTTAAINTTILQPDEVIEINSLQKEPEVVVETTANTNEAPPKKAPRLRREHVYEEISEAEPTVDMLEIGQSVAALKESLQRQDAETLNELEIITKPLPLDRMGSSEEEPIPVASNDTKTKTTTLSLAPLSSIDSASSDEERNRPQLSPVSEESDAASSDYHQNESHEIVVVEETEQPELKSSIKKESSPAPSDKKNVTFSHVEDEAEPHREDIELPEHVLEASVAHKKAKEPR